MIRKICILFFLLLLPVNAFCYLADPKLPSSDLNTEPFGEFKKNLSKEDWGINNKEKAELFNKERTRLGKRFEIELLKFIENNIDAHYWTAIFLTDKYYLDSYKPAYELGLKIFDNGIKLCEKDTEKEIEIVSFGICAAIVSEKVSDHKRAKYYKDKVESLLAKDSNYGGGKPALEEAEYEIYNSIK